LRYARDNLGVNVLFSEANLNEVESIMTKIAKDIGGSSDLIMKVDTDEFLAFYDNSTNTLTTSISNYLSGFSKNKMHPLHLVGNSRLGYIQDTMPLEEVCKKNTHSTPDNFPLNEVTRSAAGFKAVHDSKTMVTGESHINIGGHVNSNVPKNHWTKFGIVHYHQRCV